MLQSIPLCFSSCSSGIFNLVATHHNCFQRQKSPVSWFRVEVPMLVSLLFYLSSHASASTIATPPGQNATFSHGTQNGVHLTGVGLVTANFTELEALKEIKTRTLGGTRSPDNERNHHMIQLLYPLSQNVKWNTLLDDWWHHFFHIDGLTPIPDIEQCSKLPWSVGHG